MAIYTYMCATCGKQDEVVQSISSYCVTPIRPVCEGHGEMERRLTKPMVAFDMPNWGGYISPLDGSFIGSRQQQKEHMEAHQVVHYDDIAPDVARNRARIIKEQEAAIKNDLVEAVHRVEAGHKPIVESVDAIVPVV